MAKNNENKINQIPFRFDDDEKKNIEWLQKHYGEATITRTIKRCLEEVRNLLEFKERMKKAVTKKTTFEIDQKMAREEFFRYGYGVD